MCVCVFNRSLVILIICQFWEVLRGFLDYGLSGSVPLVKELYLGLGSFWQLERSGQNHPYPQAPILLHYSLLTNTLHCWGAQTYAPENVPCRGLNDCMSINMGVLSHHIPRGKISLVVLPSCTYYSELIFTHCSCSYPVYTVQYLSNFR